VTVEAASEPVGAFDALGAVDITGTTSCRSHEITNDISYTVPDAHTTDLVARSQGPACPHSPTRPAA
jgi:hypothetical protein